MRYGLVVLMAVVLARDAHADERLPYLLKQLERAKDARLRAQAALLLGSSGDSQAAEPLCRALEDAEAIVRSAAVKALGQLLDPSTLECVARRRKDPDAAVARLAATTYESLRRLRDQKPSLYVMLAPVTDKTESVAGDVLQLTQQRLRQKLASMGTLFAPEGESKNEARKMIRQKGLKGYYLQAQIEPTPNQGLRMTILCFTYPDRSLLGQVSVKASGAKPADLVRALAPKALEEASENFEWTLE